MRAFILIAAPALLLGACGKNNSADQAQNVGENLSAETIVANDVTAIDAVTGDAANMAADVPFTNELEGNLDEMVNQPKPSPRTRAPGKPPLKTPTPTPTNNSAQ